jgi:hypothetical protein
VKTRLLALLTDHWIVYQKLAVVEAAQFVGLLVEEKLHGFWKSPKILSFIKK